uniref:Uncharacterized protein n=1 Tax=Nicotiana tabacum TaxID=4097 RepID=A0A1S3YWE4_TOBAC|nr:PREDICTED: uncharacterized protein LOC107780436 [Nicotiana tabacum]
MEVYIDDMLVKTKRKEDHISHLKEAFDILRRYGMKLNLRKCTFGVSSGKFLGFLVSQRGIEVNPKQIKAIEGILEILTSKRQERQWAPVECRMRRRPKETKSVLVFATLTHQSRPRRVPPSLPSRIRSRGKCSSSPRKPRYPHLEKLALALVVASRKLRPYFQCRPIKVVTTFPLRSILHKPELSGHLAKWAIEPSGHDITYQLQTIIKSQVLADFIANFSAEILPEVKQEALRTSSKRSDLWVLYTDGASNASGSGLGLVLEVPTSEVIHQSVRCPEMTSNEAEYEAVIAGLKLALKYSARWVILRYNSKLVVNQVTGTFQIKEQRLQIYQTEIHKLLLEFDECRFDQILRAQNIEADGLAKLAAATKNITKENVVTLLHSSTDKSRYIL